MREKARRGLDEFTSVSVDMHFKDNPTLAWRVAGHVRCSVTKEAFYCAENS